MIKLKPWMIGLAMLLGCDGSGAVVNTGLAQGQSLDSLSLADAVQACAAMTTGLRAGIRDAADDVVGQVQECLGETITIPDEQLTNIQCDGAVLKESAAGCALTVGDFESCLNGALEALETSVAALSCEDFEGTDISELDGDGLFEAFADAEIPACEAFDAQCPDFATASPTVVREAEL